MPASLSVTMNLFLGNERSVSFWKVLITTLNFDMREFASHFQKLLLAK